MRKLILVAVVFLVGATILETQGFTFGDILSFKPRCIKGFLYQHYAIYVGKGNQHNLPKENEEDDIYERLGYSIPPRCVFSKLDQYEDPEVRNYLDGYTDPGKDQTFQKGTDEEISERIRETKKKCPLYDLISNNCEHHATYLRYGYRIAMQLEMSGQGLCINNPRINKQALIEYTNTPCSSDLAG